MEKIIKIFKSFEEQEAYFLSYFYDLTPSQRLQALAKIQKKNNPPKKSDKKITISKHFIHEQ